MKPSAILCFLAVFLWVASCHAQEKPYFVTYSHDLEEPDNLEIALKTTQATPEYRNFFTGATLELEYGAKGWWTTEVYLSGNHFERQHHFHGIPVGEPFPPVAARSLHQSCPLFRI